MRSAPTATPATSARRPLAGAGETAASLSATPTGKGYWVFTNRGRVIAFGDAAHLGDMSQVKLNGPVLGSVATPSGKGYYMVASDGGIFAFGDAKFAGSMGGRNSTPRSSSLVPDADGTGYWLVASDGGIFAFDAPFRGSMGATQLNKPVDRHGPLRRRLPHGRRRRRHLQLLPLRHSPARWETSRRPPPSWRWPQLP